MIAAVYCRKSNDQDVGEEDKSVARQLAEARITAARHGLTIDEAHIYADDGFTGACYENRPAFTRLIAALTPRPTFQALIVTHMDRIGREQLEIGYRLKQLLVADVKIYAEGAPVPMETVTDIFVNSAVKGFAGAAQRERAQKLTYDALAHKARNGFVTGGNGGFGYRTVRRGSHAELVIEPNEAAIVRKVFDWSRQGIGVSAIARRLNDEGAPSPRVQRGRPNAWCPSSVRGCLFRDLYRGGWSGARRAKMTSSATGRSSLGQRPSGLSRLSSTCASSPTTCGTLRTSVSPSLPRRTCARRMATSLAVGRPLAATARTCCPVSAPARAVAPQWSCARQRPAGPASGYSTTSAATTTVRGAPHAPTRSHCRCRQPTTPSSARLRPPCCGPTS
jgi:DNA invertase Pin-like site-specific DNA recombinase